MVLTKAFQSKPQLGASWQTTSNWQIVCLVRVRVNDWCDMTELVELNCFDLYIMYND